MGIVSDERKANIGRCSCYVIPPQYADNGKIIKEEELMCYKAGIVGTLSDEQEAQFCVSDEIYFPQNDPTVDKDGKKLIGNQRKFKTAVIFAAERYKELKPEDRDIDVWGVLLKDEFAREFNGDVVRVEKRRIPRNMDAQPHIQSKAKEPEKSKQPALNAAPPKLPTQTNKAQPPKTPALLLYKELPRETVQDRVEDKKKENGKKATTGATAEMKTVTFKRGQMMQDVGGVEQEAEDEIETDAGTAELVSGKGETLSSGKEVFSKRTKPTKEDYNETPYEIEDINNYNTSELNDWAMQIKQKVKREIAVKDKTNKKPTQEELKIYILQHVIEGSSLYPFEDLIEYKKDELIETIKSIEEREKSKIKLSGNESEAKLRIIIAIHEGLYIPKEYLDTFNKGILPKGANMLNPIRDKKKDKDFEHVEITKQEPSKEHVTITAPYNSMNNDEFYKYVKEKGYSGKSTDRRTWETWLKDWEKEQTDIQIVDAPKSQIKEEHKNISSETIEKKGIVENDRVALQKKIAETKPDINYIRDLMARTYIGEDEALLLLLYKKVESMELNEDYPDEAKKDSKETILEQLRIVREAEMNKVLYPKVKSAQNALNAKRNPYTYKAMDTVKIASEIDKAGEKQDKAMLGWLKDKIRQTSKTMDEGERVILMNRLDRYLNKAYNYVEITEAEHTQNLFNSYQTQLMEEKIEEIKTKAKREGIEIEGKTKTELITELAVKKYLVKGEEYKILITSEKAKNIAVERAKANIDAQIDIKKKKARKSGRELSQWEIKEIQKNTDRIEKEELKNIYKEFNVNDDVAQVEKEETPPPEKKLTEQEKKKIIQEKKEANKDIDEYIKTTPKKELTKEEREQDERLKDIHGFNEKTRLEAKVEIKTEVKPIEQPENEKTITEAPQIPDVTSVEIPKGAITKSKFMELKKRVDDAPLEFEAIMALLDDDEIMNSDLLNSMVSDKIYVEAQNKISKAKYERLESKYDKRYTQYTKDMMSGVIPSDYTIIKEQSAKEKMEKKIEDKSANVNEIPNTVEEPDDLDFVYTYTELEDMKSRDLYIMSEENGWDIRKKLSKDELVREIAENASIPVPLRVLTIPELKIMAQNEGYTGKSEDRKVLETWLKKHEVTEAVFETPQEDEEPITEIEYITKEEEEKPAKEEKKKTTTKKEQKPKEVEKKVENEEEIEDVVTYYQDILGEITPDEAKKMAEDLSEAAYFKVNPRPKKGVLNKRQMDIIMNMARSNSDKYMPEVEAKWKISEIPFGDEVEEAGNIGDKPILTRAEANKMAKDMAEEISFRGRPKLSKAIRNTKHGKKTILEAQKDWRKYIPEIEKEFKIVDEREMSGDVEYVFDTPLSSKEWNAYVKEIVEPAKDKKRAILLRRIETEDDIDIDVELKIFEKSMTKAVEKQMSKLYVKKEASKEKQKREMTKSERNKIIENIGFIKEENKYEALRWRWANVNDTFKSIPTFKKWDTMTGSERKEYLQSEVEKKLGKSKEEISNLKTLKFDELPNEIREIIINETPLLDMVKSALIKRATELGVTIEEMQMEVKEIKEEDVIDLDLPEYKNIPYEQKLEIFKAIDPKKINDDIAENLITRGWDDLDEFIQMEFATIYAKRKQESGESVTETILETPKISEDIVRVPEPAPKTVIPQKHAESTSAEVIVAKPLTPIFGAITAEMWETMSIGQRVTYLENNVRKKSGRSKEGMTDFSKMTFDELPKDVKTIITGVGKQPETLSGDVKVTEMKKAIVPKAEYIEEIPKPVKAEATNVSKKVDKRLAEIYWDAASEDNKKIAIRKLYPDDNSDSIAQYIDVKFVDLPIPIQNKIAYEINNKKDKDKEFRIEIEAPKMVEQPKQSVKDKVEQKSTDKVVVGKKEFVKPTWMIKEENRMNEAKTSASLYKEVDLTIMNIEQLQERLTELQDISARLRQLTPKEVGMEVYKIKNMTIPNLSESRRGYYYTKINEAPEPIREEVKAKLREELAVDKNLLPEHRRSVEAWTRETKEEVVEDET